MRLPRVGEMSRNCRPKSVKKDVACSCRTTTSNPALASTPETEITPCAGGHGKKRNNGSLVPGSYLPLPKPTGQWEEVPRRGTEAP